MKSLIIVCVSLGAVVVSFPLKEKMGFKAKPIPLMNIEETVAPADQDEQATDTDKISSFVNTLPFSRQQAEESSQAVVEELPTLEPKASLHSFILRGITGVGDNKRAMIVIEGTTAVAAHSYTYEDKISDTGYVVYEIHDDRVILDHTIYEDVILRFDYDTDFSTKMQKKAGDLEQKTQKEIAKVYQKKPGANAKKFSPKERQMWEERKKRYERFRQMRDSQEKAKGKEEKNDKEKKR